MVERLRELMDKSGLSNAEFARRIDVNPSIISHIMSGRNKVSLQVIESITKEFTNVNTDYLITGKGELFRSVTNVNVGNDTVDAGKSSSFPAGAFPMEGVRHAAIPGSPPPSSPEPEEPAEEQEIKKEVSGDGQPLTDASGRDIEQIVIFYSDGSFKAYTA